MTTPGVTTGGDIFTLAFWKQTATLVAHGVAGGVLTAWASAEEGHSVGIPWHVLGTGALIGGGLALMANISGAATPKLRFAGFVEETPAAAVETPPKTQRGEAP